jgi:hypothetical protein
MLHKQLWTANIRWGVGCGINSTSSQRGRQHVTKWYRTSVEETTWETDIYGKMVLKWILECEGVRTIQLTCDWIQWQDLVNAVLYFYLYLHTPEKGENLVSSPVGLHVLCPNLNRCYHVCQNLSQLFVCCLYSDLNYLPPFPSNL